MLLFEKSAIIKKLAKEAGFDFCGISKVCFLEDEAPRLEKWLQNHHHGTMSWMEQYFDMRLNPALLVPGARSVVSLLINYFPQNDLTEKMPYKISKYAYGNDYHKVIKKMMKGFVKKIKHTFGHVQGRCFVDSAPVMDKSWAAKAGLGWIGKHTNLINKQSGSYYFIAEYICDLELEPDAPIADYCGTCTKCIDACPTDAIHAPYQLDATRCISYLTIELKDEIDQQFRGKMDNWIFGCDICQDVCPWNRFSIPHQNTDFKPFEILLNMDKKDWQEINETFFELYLKNSPLNRTKLKGLKRNINFVSLSPSNQII